MTSPTSASDPAAATDLFKQGRLGEALRASLDHVRANPQDPDARFVLFLLLCFSGELERAGTALNALAVQAKHLEVETALLRALLAAEQERATVLGTRGSPLLPPDPPEHLKARVRALDALRGGDVGSADKALDEAAEATPPVNGLLDGSPYDSIRDDDDLLGSVLELFAGGRYLWLPFERIRRLEISEPRRPLDLLWAPARLETAEGDASVFLPVLYAGSHAHPDDAVRLGRATDWRDVGAHIHRGAGQRVLRAAQGDLARECGVLEVRRLAAEQAG